MLRPGPLLFAALLLLAILGFLAAAGPLPEITAQQAPAYEGQGAVRVAGLAAGVRPAGTGTWMTLHSGGAALPVVAAAPLDVPEGAWVVAQGRIGRTSGTLQLFVAGRADVTMASNATAASPSWPELAAHPGDWQYQPLRLEGRVERGELGDGAGHHVATGTGNWPNAGAVRVEGFLAYDTACLCQRLSATLVQSA
jgi:hypothetical protein